MKVRCIANTGKDLSERSIKAGQLRATEYNGLDLGKIYTVYSMFLLRGRIDYLLSVGDSRLSSWSPAELFEIVDHSLPPSWYFIFKGYETENNNGPVEALWGYKEMVYDLEHNSNLTECEPEDLKIFYQRKAEIDKWQKLKSKKT